MTAKLPTVKSICKACGVGFEHPPYARGKYCSTACFVTNPSTRRHGQSQSTEYVSWRDMKRRCLNPSRKEYARYGGRGIKVCERWMTFDNFIADMGLKPNKDYTIERKDHNGNYEPGNCIWLHKSKQSKNRSIAYTQDEDRKIKTAISRGFNFVQIAALVGRSHSAVSGRAYRLGLRSGQPCQRIAS